MEIKQATLRINISLRTDRIYLLLAFLFSSLISCKDVKERNKIFIDEKKENVQANIQDIYTERELKRIDSLSYIHAKYFKEYEELCSNTDGSLSELVGEYILEQFYKNFENVISFVTENENSCIEKNIVQYLSLEKSMSEPSDSIFLNEFIENKISKLDKEEAKAFNKIINSIDTSIWD